MIDETQKVEVRKKTLKKLEELYDRRNLLRAQVNNLELQINSCLALIEYIDKKIDLDEFGDEKNDKK